MIPRSSQRWRGLIGTGWIVVAGVAAGVADAAEGTATIAVWQVPHVTLPVTVPRRVPRVIALVEAQADPDPLRGTPDIRPETTGENAAAALAAILPERSDLPTDWFAPVEPLHYACEPRALPPCVPPPPCHPSEPPDPYDLVGLAGWPTCGPIYRGPCEPRAARDHHGAFAWYRRLHDRFVDHFYRWK